jgi:hypothetical protein
MFIGTFIAISVAVPLDMHGSIGIHTDETNSLLLLLHFNTDSRNLWAGASFQSKSEGYGQFADLTENDRLTLDTSRPGAISKLQINP